MLRTHHKSFRIWNIRFVTAPKLIKCLKQIKCQILLLMCAHIYHLVEVSGLFQQTKNISKNRFFFIQIYYISRLILIKSFSFIYLNKDFINVALEGSRKYFIQALKKNSTFYPLPPLSGPTTKKRKHADFFECLNLYLVNSMILFKSLGCYYPLSQRKKR